LAYWGDNDNTHHCARRTYTALLNTTTKQVASVAACLTLLSYVSTAVVCVVC
jgi:hypothetical protein